MVKLTRAGKIAAGIILVILCGAIYFFFFRPDPPPPTDAQGVPLREPAPVPKGFDFPLDQSSSERWSQAAIQADKQFSASGEGPLSYCSFMPGGQYEQRRQQPLDFNAILAPDARQSPYYFYDQEEKRYYYPVYPIGSGSKGLNTALGAANGDAEQMEDCMLGVEGAAVPVVVALPEGTSPPTGSLWRVKGYLAWQFLGVDPNTKAIDPYAPVVNAGEVTKARSQEVASPATSERVLNISVRRGPVAMRLSKVQFSPDQTRVWVELYNTSSEPVQAWEGPSTATIQEQGGSKIESAGSVVTGSASEQLSGLENVDSDILSSEEIPAVQGGPGQLSGYIVFPAVSPDKPVIISIPDPYPGAAGGGENNITLRLVPKLNRPA